MQHLATAGTKCSQATRRWMERDGGEEANMQPGGVCEECTRLKQHPQWAEEGSAAAQSKGIWLFLAHRLTSLKTRCFCNLGRCPKGQTTGQSNPWLLLRICSLHISAVTNYAMASSQAFLAGNNSSLHIFQWLELFIFLEVLCKLCNDNNLLSK